MIVTGSDLREHRARGGARASVSRQSCRQLRAFTRITPPSMTPQPQPSLRSWLTRPGDLGGRRMRSRLLSATTRRARRSLRHFAGSSRFAAELARPVFLHQRDAHDDFIAMLQEFRLAPAARGCSLLHRERRGSARLPRSRPAHRHHGMDQRRAPRPPSVEVVTLRARESTDARDRRTVPPAARPSSETGDAAQRADVSSAYPRHGRTSPWRIAG